MRAVALAAGVSLALATGVSPASAQQASSWDDLRVLELVERATATRQAAVMDGLRAYTADARGYVYFFLDRQTGEERNLVKTDQLAVRVYWKAPGLTRQHILGRRDDRQMPTNIRYHLDHLVIIQENFGDVIRIGDGDEVSSVIHPLAPGAPARYEYLLADSITVAFADGLDPVRVYEVQVRPRDPDQPGFVGTLFLDRETAAVVRMNFTFTPASYVDPQLDYIRVSLENSLWDRRYWLPYRQSLEIRRKLPFLDLPVGSVIRGRWEIGGYNFEDDLPDLFFLGPQIVRNPDPMLAFPFERDLYAQVDEEGLAPTPELIDIEAEATRLVRGRYLSGLGRLRLAMPPLSETVRYNRAEGWVTQGGFNLRATNRLHIGTLLGYAHAGDRPLGRVSAVFEAPDRERPSTVGLDLFLREPRDIGPVPGSSRIMNTLSSLLHQTDWTDPYFATGARARAGRSFGPVSTRAEVRYERHHGARVVAGGEPGGWRPVRTIDEGDLTAVRLSASLGSPDRLFGEAGATWANFDGAPYQEASLRLAAGRRWLEHGVELRSSLDAAVVSEGAPPQSLYLLGGRETLPGYGYRSLAGDAFWLLRVEGSRQLFGPWLRLRGVGAAGRTRLASAEVPASWDARPPRITRFSAGLGFALGWDLVLVDVVRGLNGGSWEVVLDLNRRFRDLF